MTTNTRAAKQALWFQHVVDWEASKTSQKKFCDTQQLNLIQFGYWVKRYRQQHKTRATTQQNFIALSPLLVQPQTPAGIVIELHGLKITVPLTITAPSLGLLLNTLGLENVCAR